MKPYNTDTQKKVWEPSEEERPLKLFRQMILSDDTKDHKAAAVTQKREKSNAGVHADNAKGNHEEHTAL